ncbi:unnamed protein product [Owenia fusiformis]|uniref:Uncharacterized protein n=1 Tax=Owenia fusiformis TaxID=6347 RepID=A0A8S4NH08_OWEFU|nr:unnamed protein product [Owenia fusiformis]
MTFDDYSLPECFGFRLTDFNCYWEPGDDTPIYGTVEDGLMDLSSSEKDALEHDLLEGYEFDDYDYGSYATYDNMPADAYISPEDWTFNKIYSHQDYLGHS